MNQLFQRIVLQKNLTPSALTSKVKVFQLSVISHVPVYHKLEETMNSEEYFQNKNESFVPTSSRPGGSNLGKLVKKAPMKTAQDVINRIKWDKSLDASKFTVAYEDRFIGIVEKDFRDFDWDSDLASVGPEVLAVPQHRVQYFKYENRVVWKKDTRLDDFFGSTGGGKTIIDVMKEADLCLCEQNTVDSDDDMPPLAGPEGENGDGFSALPTLDPSDDMEVSPTPVKSKKRSGPNCFIGVRVMDSHVSYSASQFVKRLENVYRHQEEREEFLQSVCSPTKHHVTLCVCKLEDDDDIEIVKQVLQKMHINEEKLSLSLLGIGQFDNNVVYAKVISKSFYDLQKRLMVELKKENINIRDNFPKFIPHMTLVKFRWGRGNYLYRPIAHLITNKKIRKWRFGLQPVEIEDILLCRISSTADDGFYETLSSSRLRYQSKDEDNDENDNYHHARTSRKGQKRRMHKRKAEDEEPSRRGKRANQQPAKRDEFISRSLTAVLRHNKFGFKIDSEGYVDINAILRHKRFKGSTKEDIYRIVEQNDKKRFTIDVDDDGVEKIKANQGHSVEVENLSLTKVVDADEYPVVVHGTFWSAWNSIKNEGLHRRSRIHIHMTTAEPSHDQHVISGMRKSCTVFVYIDIAAAMRDGIEFFVSSNGVILSSGDEDGFVKPKYFSKVIGISGGKRRFLTKRIGEELTVEDMETMEVESEVHEVLEYLLDQTSQKTEVENIATADQKSLQKLDFSTEIEIEIVVKHLVNLCIQSSKDDAIDYSDMPPLMTDAQE